LKKIFTSLRWMTVILTAIVIAVVCIIQTVYYAQIVNLNRSNAEVYAKNAATQVQISIETLFSDLDGIARNISQNMIVQKHYTEEDPYEHYLNYSNITSLIGSVIQTHSRVDNVMLYDMDGELIYYYNVTNGASQPTLEYYRLQNRVLSNSQNMQPAVQYYHVTDKHNEYLACSLQIISNQLNSTYGKKLGYIVLLIPESAFSMLWADENEGSYLLDQNDNAVFLKDDSTLPDLQVSHRDKMTFIHEEPIENTGWTVCFHMDLSETMKQYQFFQYSIILIAVLLGLLLVSWGILVQMRIVKPIVRLSGQLDHWGETGLRERIPDEYTGEIGIIADSINHLLDHQHELTRTIINTQAAMYEGEINRRETLLYALQTQVNPHFLFNTLQCIAGIAASKDAPEIVEASLALGNIFRYSMRETPQEGVTLREELAVVREYLKIIDIRFMGRYTSEIVVEEEILDYTTIKMLLQPLVENAVVHGLENIYGEGHIRISGWEYNGKIYLKVSDTGAGMTPEQLAKVKELLKNANSETRQTIQKGKIGLANIQRRIQMVYGPECGIEILSTGPEGTVIQVMINRPNMRKNAE